MAYFELMEIGFPSKIKISKLMEKCQPFIKPRHMAMETNMCCRALLLGCTLQIDEFKFGREEVHIRSGKFHLLDEIVEYSIESHESLRLKFEKGFVILQRRMIYLRLVLLGARMFSLYFSFLRLSIFTNL